MYIKNWSEFQHFKDRTPPWIKLYRHLLDDPDWHELSGDEAKTLIMLWLIASEDKKMNGNLPAVKNIAFRLRTTEIKLNQILNKLSGWLIFDDNELISSGYQHDAPETEKRQRQSKRHKLSFDLQIGWINSETFIEEFSKKYPYVDIEKELSKAYVWIKEKPSQRMKTDYSRFMDNWIKRTSETKSNPNDIFAGAI